MEFVIVDGEILKKKEANLTPFFLNRPRLYNFRIWYGYGGIPLLGENLNEITGFAGLTGIPLPALMENERELFRICKRMLNKNKLYRSGWLNFHLVAENEKTGLWITASPSQEFEFPLLEQGLLLRVAAHKKFSGNPLAKFQYYHHLTDEAEKTALAGSPYQNAIFFNEKEAVCDAIGAHIFFRKNQTLILPSPDTGCRDDVLRKTILALAMKSGLKILESAGIKKEELYGMHEVLLASTDYGIQWVMGIESKRYTRQYALVLHQKLNDYLKEKAR